MLLETDIFSKEGAQAIELLRSLIPNLTGTVFDWREERFSEIMRTDPREAWRIYWVELLGRAYIASAASIVRNDQWVCGIVSAYQFKSYLGFCASLRGFIESAADSMYSLNGVAQGLSSNWKQIKKALNGKAESPFCAQELEERLIHFLYARRVDKKEVAPSAHRALQNRQYIDTIRTFDPELERLYCKLVEIVHPAEDSVSWMVHSTIDQDCFRVQCMADRNSATAICSILDEFGNSLKNLLMAGFNNSLLTLKFLRTVDFAGVDLRCMDKVDLSQLKAWESIRNQINK
jgi:hypothetical protein